MRTTMMRTIVLALAAGLLWTPLAQAAAVGQITHLSGTLSAKRADGSTKLLSVKSEVQEGDTLGTESETYARIKFVDDGEVVMRPGTQIKINNYSYTAGKPESDNMILSMFKGVLRAVTGLIGKRNREKVSFQTETATIGIRGTTFGATVCPSPACPPDLPPGTYVDVSEGAIQVTPPGATTGLLVSAGQFGFAPPAGTPQLLANDPGVLKSFQPPPAFTQQGNSSDPCEVR